MLRTRRCALPNVYLTLDAPFANIVGLYTNVPDGGSVDSIQQQWLTHEFATAPKDKALMLAMHHPIYCLDDNHVSDTLQLISI